MRLFVLSKEGAYARYEAGTIRCTECDAIERDHDRMRGAWRFKGTGVALANLFHALAAGLSATEFVQANDGVEETAPAVLPECFFRVVQFLGQELQHRRGLPLLAGRLDRRLRLDAAYDAVRRATRPGSMLRWDCCASADLKFSMGEGRMPGGDTLHTLPIDSRILELAWTTRRASSPSGAARGSASR